MTTNRARSLRRSQTDAEALLWRHLRSRHQGVKFRRQHPFGRFIRDFYSLEAHLVIEVDGSQHATESSIASDAKRTAALEAAGLHVLRFTDREVLLETEAVLEAIAEATRGYNPSP
jgi:adenine-specific DNA-methyltransferase